MDTVERGVRALRQHAQDRGHLIIPSRPLKHGPRERGTEADYRFPEHTRSTKAQRGGPDGDGSQDTLLREKQDASPSGSGTTNRSTEASTRP